MTDLLPKVIDNQQYFHYTQLTNWDKNERARTISSDNWEKLLADIKRNGVEDAFKIDEQGIVYDGNNRLKAVKHWIALGVMTAENGQELEWIPAVVKRPKSESEKWSYAFKRNEQFASWNQEELLNYEVEFEELDMPLININFFDPKTIEENITTLENKYNQDKEKNDQKAQKPKEATCPNCGEKFTLEK